LTLHLSVHGLQSVYWPLPDSQQQWRIDGVVLNGVPHTLRESSLPGAPLHVQLPAGSHDLLVTGSVVQKGFQLTFPVLAHNVTVAAPGWTLRGVDNGRLQSNALFFESSDDKPVPQEAASKQKQLTPDPVPPYVTVRRQLKLGLNWYL